MDRTVITKLGIAGTAVIISLSACGSTAKKGETSPPTSQSSTSVASGQAVSSSASVTMTAQDFSYQLPAHWTRGSMCLPWSTRERRLRSSDSCG